MINFEDFTDEELTQDLNDERLDVLQLVNLVRNVERYSVLNPGFQAHVFNSEINHLVEAYAFGIALDQSQIVTLMTQVNNALDCLNLEAA